MLRIYQNQNGQELESEKNGIGIYKFYVELELTDSRRSRITKTSLKIALTVLTSEVIVNRDR